MRQMGITAIYWLPWTSQRHPTYASDDNHAAEPRVGRRYHLPSHATRLRLSLCEPGLGESPRAGVAVVLYVDDELLSGGRAGGNHTICLPGDLQHGSRLPVHEPGIHRVSERPRDSDRFGMDGIERWWDNIFVERL